MKTKFKHILFVSLLAVALIGVSSAKENSPSFTAGIENISHPCFASVQVYSDGAITFNYEFCHDGTFVPDMRLAKIHWVVDETFYLTGYKAKLNTTVDEIIAPPDSQPTNFDMPLKLC